MTDLEYILSEVDSIKLYRTPDGDTFAEVNLPDGTDFHDDSKYPHALLTRVANRIKMINT